VINAKTELLEDLKDGEVLAATVMHMGKKFILKRGHSENDWLQFLEQLDFNYDNGWGRQELYGTVWLWDDTWMERGEYDGSEWWEHKKLPELPEELK